MLCAVRPNHPICLLHVRNAARPFNKSSLRPTLQKRTGKVSMTTSIARLLVLLTCVNHMVGCSWWYLGTVFIPHGFDGTRSDAWHRHSAIPSTGFVEASNATVTVSDRPHDHEAFNSSTRAGYLPHQAPELDYELRLPFPSGSSDKQPIENVEVQLYLTDQETGEAPSSTGYVPGTIDADTKIPTIYIGGEWVPISGPVPNVDEPAAFDSWVMYYKGLGVEQLWPDR